LHSFDQVADWTLEHAFFTGQNEFAAAETQCRSQGSHGGPGIAEKDGFTLAARQGTIEPNNPTLGALGIEFVADTKLSQSLQHMLDIVAV
jgi:hypothetical protein